jgi:hypothetical protein
VAQGSGQQLFMLSVQGIGGGTIGVPATFSLQHAPQLLHTNAPHQGGGLIFSAALPAGAAGGVASAQAAQHTTGSLRLALKQGGSNKAEDDEDAGEEGNVVDPECGRAANPTVAGTANAGAASASGAGAAVRLTSTPRSNAASQDDGNQRRRRRNSMHEKQRRARLSQRIDQLRTECIGVLPPPHDDSKTQRRDDILHMAIEVVRYLKSQVAGGLALFAPTLGMRGGGGGGGVATAVAAAASIGGGGVGATSAVGAGLPGNRRLDAGEAGEEEEGEANEESEYQEGEDIDRQPARRSRRRRPRPVNAPPPAKTPRRASSAASALRFTSPQASPRGEAKIAAVPREPSSFPDSPLFQMMGSPLAAHHFEAQDRRDAAPRLAEDDPFAGIATARFDANGALVSATLEFARAIELPLELFKEGTLLRDIFGVDLSEAAIRATSRTSKGDELMLGFEYSTQNLRQVQIRVRYSLEARRGEVSALTQTQHH